VETIMATRNQVLDLALRGMSYEEIGLALRLSPGLAYLVATGIPADGSVSLSPEDRQRPGLLPHSTQHLSNPPVHAPSSAKAVHEWMRDMAGSDGQMLVVARRSGSQALSSDAGREGTAEERGDGGAGKEPSPDVLSVLGEEHKEIQSVLQELSSLRGRRDGAGPKDHSRRESLAGMVVERLSAHEAAEARLFWPAVADTIDGGQSIAAMARAQEKEGKRVLEQVRRAGADDERFDVLVEKLSDLVRKHIAFEDAVFVKVRDQLSEENRRQLGGRLQGILDTVATRPHLDTVATRPHLDTVATRPHLDTVATRPHPHVPSEAGLLHATTPAVAAVDRQRDQMGGRTAERQGGSESGTGKGSHEP